MSDTRSEYQVAPTAANPRFPGNDPRRKSPIFAGFLSILPGAGQVYVGYYQRGFLNIFIFGSVFSLLTSSSGNAPYMPLGIMFLFFFEFYSVLDAVRRAVMYNLALDGVEQIQMPDELTGTGVKGSFILGGILVIAGLIALSNTLLGMSLEWLENWWPIAPVGFGAYLIYQAYRDQQASKAS